MKKNRIVKAVRTAILAAAVLFSIVFIGTGFTRRGDVVLLKYSVSDDGTKITFHIIIASSMGYTRGFIDKGGGVKPHYLVFYSTFGGFNSSFGAKSEFELDLDENDTEIYFNRAGGGYELVLKKDEQTGEWKKP